MSFRCVVYNTSQFRGFSNLNITNNLAKENTVFYFIVYFIHVKTLIFSLQHTQGWYKTWLNIQLKSFNTWLFFFFFFNWCTLIKKATIKSGKIIKSQLIFASDMLTTVYTFYVYILQLLFCTFWSFKSLQ